MNKLIQMDNLPFSNLIQIKLFIIQNFTPRLIYSLDFSNNLVNDCFKEKNFLLEKKKLFYLVNLMNTMSHTI